MGKIPESELIINPDGSVYHLNLKPENLADTIITVGDPGRVYMISQHFDHFDFEMNKREFITHTGMYKGKKLSVISTGMGSDNIEIMMTEVDALFNLDLLTGETKKRKKKLNFIRIGTSGAIQSDIKLGSLLLSEYGVGFDNLFAFYDFPQDEKGVTISEILRQKLNLPFQPYCCRCSDKLKEIFQDGILTGNTITAPGFYAPQGREIRIGPKNRKLLEELIYFHEKDFWMSNFEMETSAYYGLARMLGHEAISLNAIIANRVKKTFQKNYNPTINKLIKFVMDRIHTL